MSLHGQGRNADVAASRTHSASFYLVTSNVNGKKNLGTFLRTACAFGVTQVLVVGRDRFGTHGAHRAQKHVDVVLMDDFAQAKAYLQARKCEIIGIHSGLLPLDSSSPSCSSTAVHLQLFSQQHVAFVIDNETPGFSNDEKAICDRFMHVDFPMAGQLLTPMASDSVNTDANGSSGVRVDERVDLAMMLGIVLHHFTTWAKFSQRDMEETSSQGKFIVEKITSVPGASASSQENVQEDARALAKVQQRISHRQQVDQVLEQQPLSVDSLFDDE